MAALENADPRLPIPFTHDQEADALLNDLERYPHAFVLACVMDRQVKAEKAWRIPYAFKQRSGSFEFSDLEKLSLTKTKRHFNQKPVLHRFTDEMPKNFFSAVQRIASAYGGDASRIWSDRPTSADVVFRFLGFQGVGPKIATMAANILVRYFRIPLSDYYSIDVSVDRQVRRVFERLRLVDESASNEEIIYKARALKPDFPGLLDFPAWEIGRNWCRPKEPLCNDCYMRATCPSATQQSTSNI